MVKIAFIGLMAALMCSISYEQGISQESSRFDYDYRPLLPYNTQHLSLQVHLDREAETIGGIAVYTMHVPLATSDTLQLHAAHMDIKKVAWNAEPAQFTVLNDTLSIVPPQTLPQGATFKLSISYEKNYEFGLLSDYRGTLWSSLLPKAHRHWYPVFDHPRNSFTTTVKFSLADSTAVTVVSGQKNKGKMVEWNHKRAIPSTSLAFAVGDFEQSETLAGIKKINLFSERGILNEEQKAQILESAYNALTQTQELLEIEYPFQSLQLVVLEDHHWEHKSYAAGLGFIYLNGGPLSEQVRNIILAQWLGIQRRESRWQQADAMLLLQNWIYNSIYDSTGNSLSYSDIPAKTDQHLYHNFSMDYRQQWQRAYRTWKQEMHPLIQAVELKGKAFYNTNRTVIDWQSLNDFFYNETGYYWLRKPAFTKPARHDTIRYRATLDYDELSDTLKVIFTSVDSVYSALANVQIELQHGNQTSLRKVTFTGKTDTLILNVDQFIENAEIQVPDSLHIALDLQKPMMFWLYQIRNAPSVDKQVEAAEKLSAYADNPDLQLALMDIKNSVEAPRLSAALIRTLGAITKGGIGTEQQFLKALGSEHKVVRLAALEVLKNYPENDQVKRRVERLLDVDEHPEIVYKSLDVYKTLADTASYIKNAKDLLKADEKGRFAATVLKKLITFGNVETILEQAKTYVQPLYPYKVREEVLQLIINHVNKIPEPMVLFKKLTGDSDPRIRYLSVDLGEVMSRSSVLEYLKNVMPDEYDGRVYQKMEDYIDSTGEAAVSAKE